MKHPTTPLTEEQKAQIAEELTKQARGEGNDVEAAIGLLRMGAEEVLPGFCIALEKSTVVLAVRDPEQLNTALVLKLSDEYHLAVFTRNEYATPFTRRHPEYHYLVHVEMRSLCKGVQSRIGLTINPEHPTFRFTFSPSQFAEFQKACRTGR